MKASKPSTTEPSHGRENRIRVQLLDKKHLHEWSWDSMNPFKSDLGVAA